MSYDDTPLVLATENNINIRLHAIEYPDEENAAVVVFDIYSDNHGTAGRHSRIALVRRTVPLNGKGKSDYEQIVTTAADRMRGDFTRMISQLSEKYI